METTLVYGAKLREIKLNRKYNARERFELFNLDVSGKHALAPARTRARPRQTKPGAMTRKYIIAFAVLTRTHFVYAKCIHPPRQGTHLPLRLSTFCNKN